MRAMAVLALALLASAGCERKEAEINGIEGWVLGKTQLQDASGVCSPGDITFCSHNGSIALGNQAAAVNLYFRGKAPTAPLVEIALEVRNCDPVPVGDALVQALGEPSERADTLVIWEEKLAFVAARLPATARRCEINFVSPADTERIGDLRGEG